MLFVTIFLIVLTSSFSSPEFQDESDMYRIKELVYQRENGEYYIENLLQEEPPIIKAVEADVNLYLYTRTNENDPEIILSNSPQMLNSSRNFSGNKISVFIIHGYTNNYDSPINTNITAAVLARFDVNTFVVDWSGPAGGFYVTASRQVVDVGNILGNFIYNMMIRFGLSPRLFYLIGHSLGAHVAGNTGARFRLLSGELVYSIVGLDPAGPLFTTGNIDNRLDPSDGEFTQIIHTNAGGLGFRGAIGHSDYYPNGMGTLIQTQPGCGFIDQNCSHRRSYLIYAESVLSGGFGARQCTNLTDFDNGRCNTNDISYMGEFNVDRTANGTYILRTNNQSLYAMGYLS